MDKKAAFSSALRNFLIGSGALSLGVGGGVYLGTKNLSNSVNSFSDNIRGAADNAVGKLSDAIGRNVLLGGLGIGGMIGIPVLAAGLKDRIRKNRKRREGKDQEKDAAFRTGFLSKCAEAGVSMAVALPLLKSAQAQEQAQSYTVSKGDTLSSIAARHRLNMKDLASWNSIADPNKINIGQKLVLSAPAQTAYAPDAHNPRSKYVVGKSGSRDVVTYPQGTYSIAGPLSDDFINRMASQLSFEAGPDATDDQIQAILDVAVNRASGVPGRIKSDMSSKFWKSRKPGEFGRLDVLKRTGYKPVSDDFAKRIRALMNGGTTSSDHTSFRHTSAKDTALPSGFATYPSALTATNWFPSVKGPGLATYRDDTFRHVHPLP